MYLAAIKSFTAHVPVCAVYVVDDGSLTQYDRDLLHNHVPGIQLLSLAQLREDGLPIGGTWERLIAIARLSEKSYVIQLDADTLSLGRLDEVVSAYRNNCSFTIGTWDGQTIESVEVCSGRYRDRLGIENLHVQMQAEANLDKLANAEKLRYIRGCSGFAGFASGHGKLNMMRDLSSQLQDMLGLVWSQWGSEQVMSNLIVANQPDSIVLPHPEYADCQKMKFGVTRFIHFIGTCRFKGGHYSDCIRKLYWGRGRP